MELAGLASILIPTHNRPKLLEKALKSALAQTYSPLEILVCDNSDTEETHDCIRQYLDDPRLHYYRNRETKTKAECFAFLERQARGEYLQWLMDDDSLAPDKIGLMTAAFAQQPGIVLATSRQHIIDAEDRVIGGGHSDALDIRGQAAVFDGADLGKKMLADMRNYIGEPSAALFRRRDVSKSYRGGFAVSLWLDLLAKGKVLVFRDTLSCCRCHEGQESLQPDAVLRRRIAWYQLGSEYFLQKRFLTDWNEYEMLLEHLMMDARDNMVRYNAWQQEPHYEAYLQCIKDIQSLLEARSWQMSEAEAWELTHILRRIEFSIAREDSIQQLLAFCRQRRITKEFLQDWIEHSAVEPKTVLRVLAGEKL